MSADKIHLLPDSVANQIAAGEVIQRPASVVKELVENSVDAGATQIEIHIKDAGKTLIHIIDNGCGMSETDARMAFERHATSKIRCADDLFTLHTMGFRGEALPSVAAVSEIEMRTMPPGAEIGTKLVIKASRVESQDPAICNPGTSIMVKRLFYNFVARRRFLKKDSVEFGHIVREFERLALVNTDRGFLFTHNDSVIHQLLPATLAQRIGQLFGRAVEKQLIPVSAVTAAVKINGFVGAPAAARQRNQLQYFFVNGRNMRHPYFHKAVLQCYRDLIAGDAQPNYFLNFEVDPDRIDVNIHPQKHEIKFEDEQIVWSVLTSAIREGLGKFNVGPAIDFDATDVPDIPVPQQDPSKAPDCPVNDTLDPNYDPFQLQSFSSPLERPRLFNPYDSGNMMRREERHSALNAKGWEELYAGFAKSPAGRQGIDTEEQAATVQGFEGQPVPDSQANTFPVFEQMPEARVTSLDLEGDFATALFQLKNRWIVTKAKTGLMLIDQRRAHIRVLYEKFISQVQNGSMTTQRLIFPEQVEVEAAYDAVIADSTGLLADLGFDIAHVDVNMWEIRGIPAEMGETDPRQALLAIIGDLTETGNDPGTEQRNRMALTMAATAAIKSNQPLCQAEMQHLTTELMRLPDPNYTPDGLPIVRIVGADRIAALFHR